MARVTTVKSFRGTSKTADGSLTCSKCGDKISKGDSYRWWSNRAPGMRNGIRRVRCIKSSCTPRPSDTEGNPKRAALYAMQEDVDDRLDSLMEMDEVSEDDYTSIAEDAAASVQEIVEEMREGAQNIEDGFGHETYQSQELNERADELEGQAEELEQIDLPERPDEDELRSEAEADLDEGLTDDERASAIQEAVDEEMESWKNECADMVRDAANEVYI